MIESSADTITLEGPWTHEQLLEPDGDHYQTRDRSRELTYTFRDPFLFEDPAGDDLYMLFEANTPVSEDSNPCAGTPQQQHYSGAVGIARSVGGSLLEWELLPPLFEAVCVNHELERPHIVLREGRFYLFFSTHRHMFAPRLSGFDGLYGFTAHSLRGNYQPLNDSGLVVANPADVPFRSYSWMVYEHQDELLVQSFLNYEDIAAKSLEVVQELSADEQRTRFTGTLGPTLRLGLDGHHTSLQGVLDHWHLPEPTDPLPSSTDSKPQNR